MTRRINVSRKDLLNKLRGNLEKHNEEWSLTYAGWVNEVTAHLEDAALLFLKEANAIADGVYLGEAELPRIDPMPPCYAKDYERVIGMMEMSVDDIISITEEEFRQWVQDDWSWKSVFTANSTKYGAGKL